MRHHCCHRPARTMGHLFHQADMPRHGPSQLPFHQPARFHDQVALIQRHARGVAAHLQTGRRRKLQHITQIQGNHHGIHLMETVRPLSQNAEGNVHFARSLATDHTPWIPPRDGLRVKLHRTQTDGPSFFLRKFRGRRYNKRDPVAHGLRRKQHQNPGLEGTHPHAPGDVHRQTG